MKRVIAIFVAAAMAIWLPFPILFSILLTYMAPKPRAWLLLLAAVSELLTSLPFGVITMIVFTPWVIRAWIQPKEPSITLSFLGLLAGTVFLQYLFFISFDVGSTVWQKGFSEWARYIPWFSLFIVTLSTSLTAYGLCLLREFIRPAVSAYDRR